MSWLQDLAGKAENLLNNLDEQTGAALRNAQLKQTNERDVYYASDAWTQKPPLRQMDRNTSIRPNEILNRTTSKKNKMSPTRNSAFPNDFFIPNLLPPKRTIMKNFGKNDMSQCMKIETKPIHNLNQKEQCSKSTRRLSLPEKSLLKDQAEYRLQVTEMENELLKKQLCVMNSEVGAMLNRMKQNEDGNFVFTQELSFAKEKLENTFARNSSLNEEIDILSQQINEMKKKENDILAKHINIHKEAIQSVEKELMHVKELNKKLDDKIVVLEQENNEKSATNTKLMNELRHAQSAMKLVENNYERSKEECQRLEKEWDTYKHRVKGMLQAKDNEIKDFQNGYVVAENTKDLLTQIDHLRRENYKLTDDLDRVHKDCREARNAIERESSKTEAAERVVLALRETLKDERVSKCNLEIECNNLKKQLKIVELEMNQTVSTLKAALQDKVHELETLKDMSSTIVDGVSDNSGLNVADYDTRESIAEEKIQFLTKSLVTKQEKIDNLIADNNMLRIHLDKIETKHRNEIATLKASHIVNVNDTGSKSKIKARKENMISMRIGMLIRRYPMIVLIYMVGLHLWVATALLKNSPELYKQSPMST